MGAELILAIDPGRDKCGLALVAKDGQVLLQEVVPRTLIIERVKEILPEKAVIVLGDGTGSQSFFQELTQTMGNIHRNVVQVDEHLSTEEARQRYFEEHPPKGWRRLIPVTLQVPPVPVDDYVAVILAERFLAGRKKDK